MNRYRLNLIGPFGLFAPDGHRIDISSQKGVALLALIVVAPGGVRSRRKLEALLWGGRPAKQAQDSLRRELSNLRKRLSAHGAGDLLISETKRVGAAVERIEVDVFSLGVTPPDSRVRLAGDFLEGIDLSDCDEFEEWLRDERERVRHMIEVATPQPAVSHSTPAEAYGDRIPPAVETLGHAPRLAPKPSIAVLPFGAPPQSWLGVGMADEISVCLSAFPQLFIVSSNGARALADAGLGWQEIARRLGVRYVLEGTVAQDGSRLRVSAALLDVGSGEQFWADTFLGEADNAFELQQQVAGRIAPQIWTKVDVAERQRGLRSTGPLVSDYERYWRANALSRSWDRDSISEAITLSLELVGRDPTCPWATSLAAYCQSVAWLLQLSPDREAVRRRAITHLQAALRYGGDNVEALGYCAGTLLNIGGDIDLADRLIATALSLLPAHQPALFWGGWVDVLRGDADRAVGRFELALRVNPVTGAMGQTLAGIGLARLLQGRPGEAFEMLEQAEKHAPGFPPARLGLAVAAQLSGRTDLAREIARELLSAGGAEMAVMLRRPDHQRLFASALQQAAASTRGPARLREMAAA